MFKLISSFFGPRENSRETSNEKDTQNYKIQSFTFYIPSPPPRSSGYREKQFDKLFYEFINKGFDILHFTTQASTGEKQSGMWLIFVVKAKNAKAEALNLNEFLADQVSQKSEVKESIDGLYYIDDRAEVNE